MKGIIEEFGMLAVYIVVGIMLILAVTGFALKDNSQLSENLPESNVIEAVNPKFTNERPPTIRVAESIYVRRGKTFNPLLYVEKAEDSVGNNIKDSVLVYGKKGLYAASDIDTAVTGKYKIRYVVRDRNGLWAWTERVVNIVE